MGARVVVLSRAGVGSLTAQHVAQIEEHATVDFVVRQQAPGADEAVRLLASASVLATTNVTLPRLDDDLLRRLPRLRSVVLYATGYEHVDLATLERHGVALSVLPAYATAAVAEHALGLLLTLATRTHLANDKARGLVAGDVSLRGVELGGRTLGIIGVGRIGSHLARISTGLGMSVIGSDPDTAARARAEEVGIEMTSTDDLLERAHAVAVCASTDPEAPVILDEPRIRRCSPGLLLVNVGRPALVDTAAVIEAVRHHRVRGYAVDEVVLDPRAHADLVAEGRIVQTSHSAWWRDEVLHRGAEHFGRAILAAVRGEPLDLVTGPELSTSATGTVMKEAVA